MHRKLSIIKKTAVLALALLTGCGPARVPERSVGGAAPALTVISPTQAQVQLEDGLSVVGYQGDYGFSRFLEQGGASSDAQVMDYLSEALLDGDGPTLQTGGFGCSTLSVPGTDGGALFGRNFDWEACDALIVSATPHEGYASVSTVNLSFLSSAGIPLRLLPEQAVTTAAVYAPLDGMNEKGLCAAVLMIEDADTIDQNTGKPGITTTTAIRLLLDRAATVDEALTLLAQYDMHASMDMMVHFAIADAAGRSVAVEYVNNEMVVTETPVLTNFYLAEGEKHGIGSAESHTRYEMLLDALAEAPQMTMDGVRDAMDSVSKDGFNEFSSTEWTVVYDQNAGELRYFHRENYAGGYVLTVPSAG
ncbi:linear amide C-N hydrolase [Butyricicoccus faecihominis]|uniref:linear amide C-N hydrolase n=1 Tax=Butyricicoccus faecihominis TaxID=1712515 RepID=UPI00247A0A32|nr:C45 family peptidase [Butyricicoccus faecihominis]MCQ5128954.1 linear amide C-N hydrolase [Butyricicoccus faecihominis]